MSDLEDWLKAHRITEVECIVADVNGIARGKILPAVQVPALAER